MSKLNNFASSAFRIIFAVLMLVIAIFATTVSTGLTIYSFNRMTNNMQDKMIVGGFFVLMQLMVLLGGLSLTFIAKYCPQHYKFIKLFTKVAFVLSVLSTTTYFSILDITEREKVITELLKLFPFLFGTFKTWLIEVLTNVTLVWLSCIMLDLMAMRFPAVGIDLLIKNNIVTKVDDIGFFGKVFYIFTAGIQTRINTKYSVKKFKVEQMERTAKEELKKMKDDVSKKEEPIVKDLEAEQEKNDAVDEEDPKVNHDKNIVQFPNKKSTTGEETDNSPEKNDNKKFVNYTEKERDTYLEYIKKNRRKDNSIPSSREVLEACKNSETINLNNKKITAIREELYKNNILIRPNNGDHNTFFTPAYINILDMDVDVDISEKYEDLDKDKVNKLGKQT